MLEILETIKQRNEILFYFGLLAFIGTIITAILTQTTSIQIMGINAYYKPMKFFLSTAIFAWTLAFYMQYLQNQQHVSIVSWITAIGLAYELVAITMQAARNKISHYNNQTPFDTLIYALMGLVITIVILSVLYIGILFFTQKIFSTTSIVIWSIRLSIIVTVIFSFEGFLMGSYLKHTIGAEDGTKGLPVLNWSRTNGDLRVAHFLGLHAIQVIPIISYYIAKNTTHVFIIATLYLVIVTATLIQALLGKPLF
ncbi:MAG: hypothetical protein H0U95_09305 [Bacteroidetes bacterium]|nr:hypothetical protein [Bacteroidota bacterium]